MTKLVVLRSVARVKITHCSYVSLQVVAAATVPRELSNHIMLYVCFCVETFPRVGIGRHMDNSQK
jgi:hypothetical protein